MPHCDALCLRTGPAGPPGLVCEAKVSSPANHVCPVTQTIDGVTLPCGPFDCACEAKVTCPAGKKVSSCYCYNSNPRTKTADDRSSIEKYYPDKHRTMHRGSFPWMLTSVSGFAPIPGEVGDDGTCSCEWVNTMLLVSLQVEKRLESRFIASRNYCRRLLAHFATVLFPTTCPNP